MGISDKHECVTSYDYQLVLFIFYELYYLSSLRVKTLKAI